MKNVHAQQHVVILDGPIGVGKTTLGRALAHSFAGVFLDGDDFSDPGKPWYGASLSTNRAILQASKAALLVSPAVFIAYPMRCINWVFFDRSFGLSQIPVICIGLQTSLISLTNGSRSRQLSTGEIDRSIDMMEQGYGARPFSEFVLRTESGSIDAVTAKASERLRRIFAAR